MRQAPFAVQDIEGNGHVITLCNHCGHDDVLLNSHFWSASLLDAAILGAACSCAHSVVGKIPHSKACK